MKEKVTIITPTFNRKKMLYRLFESLLKQTCDDFIWLIVDDGSNDNTNEIIEFFKKSNFKVEYYYKKNGGKHTALNLAFEHLETDLAIIVDSDDYLVHNAIEKIIDDWNKYSIEEENLCGLCYLKAYENHKIVTSCFPNDVIVANYNEYIINNNIKGDLAEVFKSNILCQYKFPEFEHEKFIGEGVIWSKIAHKYNMVFINVPIYICEYLNDGLTKNGRKLRINNPKGGMYHAEEYMNERYSFFIREKNFLLYLTYAFFNKTTIKKNLEKYKYNIFFYINIIPSYVLYRYWKYKYGDKKNENNIY